MALPQPGEIVADKYVVEGTLGEGAMGVVLAARHSVTNKPVAIKWVMAPPGKVARARMLAEAKNAGRIHHPNVVDVYDYGERDDAVFLVMERLVGLPLSGRPRTPMTPRDACRLMLPILRGVAAAHARDVLHRDLKPANIFLCQDSSGQASSVKILDFGISKLLTPDATKITSAGSVLGTPAYMAPEQFRGDELDPRCDQYALGCIVYELLEAHDPFEASEMSELVSAKMKGSTRPFTQLVPAALQSVVHKAMHPDRAKRFASIAQLGEALEPFAEGSRFTDTDANWTESVGIPVPIVDAPKSRRGVRLWVEVAVALAIAVVVGVAVLHARESAEPVAVQPDAAPEIEAAEAEVESDSQAQAEAEREREPEPEPLPSVETEPRLEPRETRMRRPRVRETRQHRTGMLTLEDF